MDKINIKADLHMHSIGSDGSDTPEQMVATAKAKGLSLIAMTDHDSVSMVKRAKAAGQAQGLPVIAGIELSVQNDTELHILGYFIDEKHTELFKKTSSIAETRLKRIKAFIATLSEQGIHIKLEDIKARACGGVLSRAHLAQTLVDFGHCKDKDEAFNRFLSQDSATFVEKEKMGKKECIELIDRAGGISVLAHPVYYLNDQFENLLDELLQYGLNGLEAYHPDHNAEQAAYFDKLAQKKGMLVTSGSDYHGVLKPKIQIGCETRRSDYLVFCTKLMYKKATR